MVKECAVCGKLFEAKVGGQKVCSPECRKIRENERHKGYYHGSKMGAWGFCKLRPNPMGGVGGIICTDYRCETCGWNPEVEAERIKNLVIVKNNRKPNAKRG